MQRAGQREDAGIAECIGGSPLAGSFADMATGVRQVRDLPDPVGEAVESGLEQLSAVTRQLRAVTATVRRQQREACELTLESVRDMPNVPMLQPQQTLKASGETAQAFTAAYVRWLREWRDVLGAWD